MCNILILSAGTRNLIVRYFKKELGEEGRVIATDCSEIAPAPYEADKAYIVPRIDAPDYIDRVLEICGEEKITGVFSLIDPELALIAAHREEFEEAGTQVICSSKELCDLCLDKYGVYRALTDKGIRGVKSYLTLADVRDAIDADIIRYPLYIKPRYGSASIGINVVPTKDLLHALFRTMSAEGLEPMVQEYIVGEEYGADAYVDMISGKCTAVFLKKKLKMRAGETDKAVGVNDPECARLVASVAESFGFRGMIDIDLFRAEDEWIVSEINPRFGGGYPLAYESGVNFPAQVIANLKGEENPVRIGNYREGTVMMKYFDGCFMHRDELTGGGKDAG